MSLHIGYIPGANAPPNLHELLPPDRYKLVPVTYLTEDTNLDCLLVFDEEIPTLHLPIVVISEKIVDPQVVHIPPQHITNLPHYIEQSIRQFLHRLDRSQVITEQQKKLAQKLKERLGYLGVYYKRDPNQFLRAMPPDERRAYLAKLTEIYKSIILEYFKESPDHLNQKIDEFASMAFLADVSVSQILEIHMNLMEQLSKQLRIEGHKDEILLDYRITLIDVIAHLCEMYRRSIPPKAGNL